MMIFTHKSVKIHMLGNKVKNCHHKYSLLNIYGNVLSPGVKSSQDNTGEDHDNHKYDDHIDSMRI